MMNITALEAALENANMIITENTIHGKEGYMLPPTNEQMQSIIDHAKASDTEYEYEQCFQEHVSNEGFFTSAGNAIGAVVRYIIELFKKIIAFFTGKSYKGTTKKALTAIPDEIVESMSDAKDEVKLKAISQTASAKPDFKVKTALGMNAVTLINYSDNNPYLTEATQQAINSDAYLRSYYRFKPDEGSKYPNLPKEAFHVLKETSKVKGTYLIAYVDNIDMHLSKNMKLLSEYMCAERTIVGTINLFVKQLESFKYVEAFFEEKRLNVNGKMYSFNNIDKAIEKPIAELNEIHKSLAKWVALTSAPDEEMSDNQLDQRNIVIEDTLDRLNSMGLNVFDSVKEQLGVPNEDRPGTLVNIIRDIITPEKQSTPMKDADILDSIVKDILSDVEVKKVGVKIDKTNKYAAEVVRVLGRLSSALSEVLNDLARMTRIESSVGGAMHYKAPEVKVLLDNALKSYQSITKTLSAHYNREVISSGLESFSESYVAMVKDISLYYISTLPSNKFEAIHSSDTARVGKAIKEHKKLIEKTRK